MGVKPRRKGRLTMPAMNKKRIKKSLTGEQIRFARFLFEHGGAKKAYREAGLPARSELALRKAASRLANNKLVLQFVRQLSREAMERVENYFEEEYAQWNESTRVTMRHKA